MNRSSSTMELTRRQVLFAGLAALSAPLPSLAAESRLQIPNIPFIRNRAGDGFVGPYGEVRTIMAEGTRVPIQVLATGGLAAIDLSQGAAFVRIGPADRSEIVLTSDGIRFGSAARPVPWSRDSIIQLTATLQRDLIKARGAILLRSALHSTYPIAVKELKGGMPKGLSAALSKGARGLAVPLSTLCSAETITETSERTVREYVEVWKSAEKRYKECLDREIARDPCKSLGPGALLCAAPICAAHGFVDVLVGVVEVVTTIVETVVRTVISCNELVNSHLPSPWDLPGIPFSRGFFPQPAQAFSPKDITDAVKLLGSVTGSFGPFAKCLLGGNWSFTQLNTPLRIGGGNVAFPYGVKVCISTKCARMLAANNVGGELADSWVSALSVLAALSPEFQAFAAASMGIYASPAAVAAVAAAGGLGAVGVQCAAILLAFIILALIYATAISAQLAFHDQFTENFDDGVVCIEHPSFLIALIKIASVAQLGPELIPPIVTG